MLKSLLARIKTYGTGAELRAQALRGGAWLGAGTIAAQFFRLGRNILLTRLLAPDSFGVMAIVISISSVLDTFTEIGIREAVIQNPKGCDEQYLNAAWWLSAGRAVFSYGIVFIAAPHIAQFYHSPELTGLTRIALLGIVFRGVMSPGAFAELKRLQFRNWAVLQYGSSIAGTLVTIGLTFWMRNVWALAAGFAAEYLVLFVASYALFPFRLSFGVHKQSAKDLLKFSKGIFGLAFLNMIFVRADIFVLGRLIPSEQLGMYTIAIYLAQAPAAFALNYQSQILIPVFSKLQADPGRTNAVLAKGTSLLSVLSVPMLVFVVLSGRTALTVLYGPRYAAGFVPLVIATAIAFINVANAQITALFYAAGRPELHRHCLLVMSGLMILFIYPAVRHFGTTGAQLAALLTMVAGYVIQFRQLRILTGYRFRSRAKNIGQRIFGSLVVLGLAVLIREGAQLSPALNLIVGAGAATVALLAIALLSLRLGRDRLRTAAL
jgi:lipopolysaccharide exporter